MLQSTAWFGGEPTIALRSHPLKDRMALAEQITCGSAQPRSIEGVDEESCRNSSLIGSPSRPVPRFGPAHSSTQTRPHAAQRKTKSKI